MSRASPPAHPEVEIIEVAKGFERFLRMEVIRFRHRRFSGEWSAPQTHDVLRRGQAVGIVLYDPDRDTTVLIEQFRLPALLAGASPWQIEVVAGLVDAGETPETVAIRETREEIRARARGRTYPDPALPSILRRLGRKRFYILCPRRFDLGDRPARRARGGRRHPRRGQDRVRSRSDARRRRHRKRPHPRRPLLARTPPRPPSTTLSGKLITARKIP